MPGPSIADLAPWSAYTSILLVVAIEIVAGLLVFLKPRYAAYVVAAWIGIIVNLLILGDYYDVALRDFGLLLAALALARLAARYDGGERHG